MIFVVNNKKYDTDNMTKISNKCRIYVSAWNYYPPPYYLFFHSFGGLKCFCDLYLSVKGRYVVTYKDYTGTIKAKIIKEREVKELLKEYDILMYEKFFGVIEEG